MERQSLVDRGQNAETDGKKVDEQTSVLPTLKGIIAKIFVALVFTTSATCVQLLQRTVPDFELDTCRFSTTAIVLLVWLLITRKSFKIPVSEIFSVLCYGFIAFVDTTSIYIAVTMLPLSSAQSVQVTSVLVSGIPLSAIFWKEEITLKRVTFAMMCVCGVFLVVQPEFILTAKRHHHVATLNTTATTMMTATTETMYTERNTSKEITGTVLEHWEESILFVILEYVLSCLSGCSITLYTLLLKRNPFLTDNIILVIFWSSLLCALISSALMVAFEQLISPRDWSQLVWIFGHSATFVCSRPLVFYAVKHISGNFCNIIHSTNVVFFLVSQYTILSSIMPGNKNWIEVVGIMLVLLGTSMGSIVELLKVRS